MKIKTKIGTAYPVLMDIKGGVFLTLVNVSDFQYQTGKIYQADVVIRSTYDDISKVGEIRFENPKQSSYGSSIPSLMYIFLPVYDGEKLENIAGREIIISIGECLEIGHLSGLKPM